MANMAKFLTALWQGNCRGKVLFIGAFALVCPVVVTSLIDSNSENVKNVFLNC